MTTTWRGESPTSSWALTSAPLSKRSLAMVTCLLSTARRRGVCWRPFRRLTSEPGQACNEVAKTWCNNNKNRRLVVQTLDSADHLITFYSADTYWRDQSTGINAVRRRTSWHNLFRQNTGKTFLSSKINTTNLFFTQVVPSHRWFLTFQIV